MLNFEYFPAPGTASANGIFIPIESLPGLAPNELSSDPITQDCKVALAIFSQLESSLTDNPKLGLTATRGIPVGVTPSVFNQGFTFNTVLMGNYKNNTLSPVPSSTVGSNADVGKLYFDTLFSGAKKLAATEVANGAGVLIPSAELANYGAQDHANINIASDMRAWCFALISSLINNVDKRASNERSAIISATKGANAILVPPASFTSAIDPLTSLLPSDLPLRVFLTSTYNIVIQMKMYQSLQSYDVAVMSLN